MVKRKNNIVKITFWHCYYCGADNISESEDIKEGGIISCGSCDVDFCTQPEEIK